MAQPIEEHYESHDIVDESAEVHHLQAVEADPYAARRRALWRAEQWLYLALGVIEALIGIRFALRLLAANTAAPFVSFVYNLSYPFVAPLLGIFPAVQTEGSVFEPHSIVALLVWALVFWLIARLMWLALGETRSGVTREVHASRRQM